MRVACISATPLSMAPISAAFSDFAAGKTADDDDDDDVGPEFQLQHLLDDSLSSDLNGPRCGGVLDPSFDSRFLSLARYAVDGCGCDAVLFTCSAFGAPIEKVKAHFRGSNGGMPVLKPNEAMMEDALRLAIDTGGGKKKNKIGVLATFAPTITSITKELEELTEASGASVELVTRHVPGAMSMLGKGDMDAHDRMIAAEAKELPEDCSVICLAQFSMARAAPLVRDALKLGPLGSVAVLTSPDSAVAKLARISKSASNKVS